MCTLIWRVGSVFTSFQNKIYIKNKTKTDLFSNQCCNTLKLMNIVLVCLLLIPAPPSDLATPPPALHQTLDSLSPGSPPSYSHIIPAFK